MGKDKAASTGPRAHDEQSGTQQDCCGTTCSLGEVQGAAEEGSVKVLPSEQKERERDFFPLSFCFCDLVVLRVHGSPAVDLVPDEPQLRRNPVDISDLAGVARIAGGKAALCPEDRGKGSIEIAVEKSCFGFNKGRQVVEEMPRHAIDGKTPKQHRAPQLRKASILDRLSVRVGRNYFSEKILRGTLRLIVVCVRHRVYKPSLSV